MTKVIISLLIVISLGVTCDSKPVETDSVKINTDSLIQELEKLDLYGQSKINNQEIQVAQYQPRTCYAYATCWDYYGNPYTVNCYATGQGCSYYARNGEGVQCTGYDQFGYWNTWWVRC